MTDIDKKSWKELTPEDKEKYNIDSKGQVYHYHTLASVDSVSQTSGTTGGGQLVEISGSGFDSAPGKTKVYLGEAECDVEDVANDMVSVRTPPQSSGADNAVFDSIKHPCSPNW